MTGTALDAIKTDIRNRVTESNMISEVRAHKLAHMIEWLHALDVARHPRIRQTAEELYDPHAATELGDLIYNYVNRPSDPAQPTVSGESNG